MTEAIGSTRYRKHILPLIIAFWITTMPPNICMKPPGRHIRQTPRPPIHWRTIG